jgi:hypothetical protein
LGCVEIPVPKKSAFIGVILRIHLLFSASRRLRGSPPRHSRRYGRTSGADQQSPRSFAALGLAGTAQRAIPTKSEAARDRSGADLPVSSTVRRQLGAPPPKSPSEKSDGSCLPKKGWMARRDEGAYPTVVCDRGATKPASPFWANPPGDGSFVRGLCWLNRHSPLRGCSGLAASASLKIPRRRAHPIFQTGSQGGTPNGKQARLHR